MTQNLQEMHGIPFIDIHAQGYVFDPHKELSRAREQFWIARFSGGYIALDYQAIKDFLSDARLRSGNRDITAIMGVEEGTPFERFNSHNLGAIDGDAHRRLRTLIASSFTPREADKHRQYMRDVFNEILDQVTGKGSCDFAEVAARYPITIMCRLLGVATADIDTFEQWVQSFSDTHSFDPATIEPLNNALTQLFDYTDNLVRARRNAGEHPDDLLQSLVDASANGDKLNDEELRIILTGLLSAGYDTTKNQLIFIMKILCDCPEEYEKLVADASYAKTFIEESLRFLNPIGLTTRAPNEDLEYRGVVIPANTIIGLPILASGRDPEINRYPDTFSSDRASIKHLAFGQGAHMCVGMFLARALLEEALLLIVQRIRNPKLAGELSYRPFQGVWSLDTLPISFDQDSTLKAG